MSTTAMTDPMEIAGKAIVFNAAQKLGEFAQLIDLVMKLEPKVILEIGSMNGGSLLAWRLAAPEARIVSVSLTDGPFGGGTMNRWLLLDGDEPIEIVDEWLDMDSHDPATLSAVLEIVGNEQVDFLFIDGDHAYEGVRQDFAMYGWLVRRGGLIGFHDILSHAPETGVYVRDLWERLKERFDTEEFVVPSELRDYGVWGGIGVIRW